MIVRSANDNDKATIYFKPYLTNASNLSIPQDAVDLAGLLNVLKTMPERKDK